MRDSPTASPSAPHSMFDPPKFTSFRAKIARRNATPPSPSDNVVLDTDYDLERRHRHVHRRDSAAKHEDSNKHRIRKDDGRSQKPYAQEPDTQKAIAKVREDDQSREWIVDCRGDPGIIQYGSIKRTAAHAYRRPPGTKLLGSERGNYAANEVKHILLSNLSRAEVRGLRHGGIYVDPKEAQVLGLEDHTVRFDAQGDFVALGLTRKRKRGATSPEKESLGNGSTSDSDSVDAEELDSGSKARSTVRQRHADLQKALKERPRDVSSWLDYVSIQDDWAGQGLNSTDQGSGKADAATIARLKLSIFDSALKSVPKDDPARETLLLDMMDVLETTLSSNELTLRWHDVVRENPRCGELWLGFLARIQTEPDGFRLDACREHFRGFFDDSGASNHVDIEQTLLAFLRLTTLLRTTGFAELAVALWQTLLEIRFFTVDGFETSDGTDRVRCLQTAFEEFWDSERPRLGEEGSVGWQCDGDDSGNVSLGQHIPAFRVLACKATAWAQTENDRERQCRFPGKTTDEPSEIDDDPYHTILFSDIEPFFGACILEYRPEAVIQAFLHFCGLPTLPASGNKDDFTKIIARDGLVNCAFTTGALGSNEEQQPSPFLGPTGSETDSAALPRGQQTCTETLFAADAQPFAAFTSSTYPLSSFVERTLANLVRSMPEDDRLAEYYLAFLTAASPKRARKAAKSLLKTRSHSLRLYNAYALIELRLSGPDAADQVFATTLEMSRSFSAESRLGAIILWRTWVWTALERKELDLARSRLSMMGAGPDMGFKSKTLRETSRTDLLRAEDILHTNLGQCLKTQRNHPALLHIQCLAYLAYTSATPPSLPAASGVYSTHIQAIAHLSESYRELYHQNLALLTTHHIRVYGRAFPPKSLHEMLAHLTQVASDFPRNYIILTALSELRPRTDRIRSLLPSSNASHTRASSSNTSARKEISTDPATLPAWTVLLETEIARTADLGGSPHVVRRLFERATAVGGVGRHCGSLWKWSLDWEIMLARSNDLGSASMDATARDISNAGVKEDKGAKSKKTGMEMKRARHVWTQGLRALPWMTGWVVLGLERFGAEMTREESLGHYDGMIDKGMRVCVDMRDFFEKE